MTRMQQFGPIANGKTGNSLVGPLPERRQMIIKPKIDHVYLAGHETSYSDKTDHLLYDDVRRDVTRLAGIPVTAVALQRVGRVYSGVLEVDGKPVLFAVDSRGFKMREPQNEQKARDLFAQLVEAEQEASQQQRHEESEKEYEALVFDMTALKKGIQPRGHAGYTRRDPRTGKMEQVREKNPPHHDEAPVAAEPPVAKQEDQSSTGGRGPFTAKVKLTPKQKKDGKSPFVWLRDSNTFITVSTEPLFEGVDETCQEAHQYLLQKLDAPPWKESIYGDKRIVPDVALKIFRDFVEENYDCKRPAVAEEFAHNLLNAFAEQGVFVEYKSELRQKTDADKKEKKARLKLRTKRPPELALKTLTWVRQTPKEIAALKVLAGDKAARDVGLIRAFKHNREALFELHGKLVQTIEAAVEKGNPYEPRGLDDFVVEDVSKVSKDAAAFYRWSRRLPRPSMIQINPPYVRNLMKAINGVSSSHADFYSISLLVHEMLHSISNAGPVGLESENQTEPLADTFKPKCALEEATTELLARHYTPGVIKASGARMSNDLDTVIKRPLFYATLKKAPDEVGHEWSTSAEVYQESDKAQVFGVHLDATVGYATWCQRFGRLVMAIEAINGNLACTEENRDNLRNEAISDTVLWWAARLKAQDYTERYYTLAKAVLDGLGVRFLSPGYQEKQAAVIDRLKAIMGPVAETTITFRDMVDSLKRAAKGDAA